MRILAALLLTISFAGQPLLASERASCAMAAANGAAHHVDGRGMTCEQPADDSACQLMASCSQIYVIVAESSTRVETPAAARVRGVSFGAPPSRNEPPELPPPRA